MAIRMQPKEIEVPEGTPFMYDLLGRKENAEILTHVLNSIEGPSTLAIDGKWGFGKSTFLRLWSQKLRKDGYPVIAFNAWESDYAENAFAALSTELSDGISLDTKLASKVKQAAIKVSQMLSSSMIQIAINNLPANKSVVNFIEQLSESYGEARYLAYKKTKKFVEGFKQELEKIAKEVSKKHSHKPLIIMIDELDRCRPTYAIELLEVAKHLFSVERIVFILAVNRTELEHSIKALYGQGFDAEGYLQRFIDLDYQLPSPNRDSFITSMLSSVDINKYFKRTHDQNEVVFGPEVIRDMLCGVLGKANISLREISQAIHRLGLVLASMSKEKYAYSLATVVAIVIRAIDKKLYKRFLDGEADDIKIVDAIFPGRENSIELNKKTRQHFEEAITREYEEIYSQKSALIKFYQEIVEDVSTPDRYRQHAEKVLQFYMLARESKSQLQFFAALRNVIPRIELFAEELEKDDEKVEQK